MRRSVFEVIRDEIHYDVGQAELIVERVPRGQIPYPAFSTDGWTLMSQAPVFSALEPGAIYLLVRLYSRLRTANELHAQMSDLSFGGTGVLAVTAIESLPEAERATPGNGSRGTKSRWRPCWSTE